MSSFKTTIEQEQDPNVLTELDNHLDRGLFQYFLQVDGSEFEGYANHTDKDIKYYDADMKPVYTLDKSDIRIVHFNANDVLSIISVNGKIYMER